MGNIYANSIKILTWVDNNVTTFKATSKKLNKHGDCIAKGHRKFHKLVLDSENKRNYALVTLLAYAGLRISEALNLKRNAVNHAG
ncbi:site-specific integrase [Bacillus methanolicus]|uniref:Uncharacterized protein n=1 Tax=Bacillus methanolicus (strain MGA3 / ATCC 53907) TaxID=796606 RepID=I3E3B4_BACMM|nr:hypothetical protein BMMGA3_02305 [Bacillus methanolicus MGA3]EIJ80985.1 putative site-specific recombinase/integrase [Bacillus methanolicus MGA3]